MLSGGGGGRGLKKSLAGLTARTRGVKTFSGSHGASSRLLRGDAAAADDDGEEEEEGEVMSGGH